MVMAGSGEAATGVTGDDARLANLGYQPQLSRVLGLFANFSVAVTYLSPMVGIYSLFVLGLGTGGPAFLGAVFIPLVGTWFVVLVFSGVAGPHLLARAPDPQCN